MQRPNVCTSVAAGADCPWDSETTARLLLGSPLGWPVQLPAVRSLHRGGSRPCLAIAVPNPPPSSPSVGPGFGGGDVGSGGGGSRYVSYLWTT